MATRRATKAWSDLSPAYRSRMERNLRAAGLTPADWGKPQADRIRTAARGHGATPERPTRKDRPGGVDESYRERRGDLVAQVIARKHELFSTTPSRGKYGKGYNARRSARNVTVNPATGHQVPLAKMREFLAMDDWDVMAVDWRDNDWAFLFYH